MSNFRVGQKVVCVADYWTKDCYDGVRYPTEGEVYTLRTVEFDERHGCVFVHLEEIKNPVLRYQGGMLESSFDALAFRPLVERKTDISIFKAMLTPKTVEVAA
jgi:hypothetical protein